MGINLHAVEHLLPLHPFLLFCTFFFCLHLFFSVLRFFVLVPAVLLCGIGSSLLCHCSPQQGNFYSHCMSITTTNDLVTNN